MKKKNKPYAYLLAAAVLLLGFGGYGLYNVYAPVNADIKEVSKITPAESGAEFWFYAPSTGQGDVSVLKAGGKTIVVDAADTSTKNETIGKISAATGGSIDILILTHAHADHIGCAAEFITNFDVGEIYMNRPSTTPTTKTYESFLTAAAGKNLEIKQVENGDTIKHEELLLEFFVGNPTKGNLNNDSIVTRVSFKGHSVLLCGDIESKGMTDIAASGPDFKADIIKVPHHGSTTSINDKFYDIAKPSFAVIMVGKNNYGHPAQKLLDMLSDRKIKTFRTDTNGDILFEFSQNGIGVKIIREG